MGLHEPVLLLMLAVCHTAFASYDPTYGRNAQTCYNVTGVFNRFPNITVLPETDYDYFISDINFDAIPGQILLGAADRLYLFDNNLTEVDQFLWETDSQLLGSCSDTNPNFTCRNHIRVYKRLSTDDDLLFVCGTQAAQDPQCRIIDISSGVLGTNYTAVPASDGIISFYPEFSGFGEFRREDNSDITYFTAGLFGSTSQTLFSISYQNVSITDPADPNTLLTEQRFRTIASNNNWLRTPVTFIDYYRADYPTATPSDYEFYFVFLRENLFDIDFEESDIVYTRIVRICRNDPGSQMVAGMAHHFTSYIKARIYCERTVQPGREFFGSIAYQYNDMSSMVFNEDGRYYENGEWVRMMYGAFSGPSTGPLGSALCVYRADDSGASSQDNNLFNIFSFDFEDSSTGMTAVNNEFRCDASGRGDTEAQNQVLISRDVEQVGVDPLLVFQDLHVTQMALDSVCVVRSADDTKCVNQDVLFLGTDTGKILKVVFGLLNGDIFPVIAEELTLDDDNAINEIKVMNIENSTYVYATTLSKVYQLPVERCSRRLSCSDCLTSQDPYCVWNATTRFCERSELTATADVEGDVPDGIYQSIHNGLDLADSVCPVIQLGFSNATYEVGEGAGVVQLTITASSPDVTDVEFYTSDGTATADSDYVSASGPVVFPAGQNETSVQVSIIDDSTYEGNEYFSVGLRTTRSGTGVAFTQDVATVTIQDDDVVTVQFSSSELTVPEGSCTIEVVVLKTGSTLFEVVVGVSTVVTEGSAGVNEDYTPTEVELHFSPNQTQLSFVIEIIDDGTQEPPEFFLARLELGEGQTTDGVELGQDVTINIEDDDNVNFYLSSDEITVGESDGPVTLTIFKSGATLLNTTILYSTSSGNATDGDDYTSVPSTRLTYLPNEVEMQVTFDILDNDVLESPENFNISLTSTGDPRVGTILPRTANVLIADDDGVVIELEVSEYAAAEGTGTVEIALVKRNVSDIPVTVLLSTISGSARAPEDYAEVTQAIVMFPAADDRLTYMLSIEDDSTHEAEESFVVRLSLPDSSFFQRGVQLGTSEATITITDDDDVQIGFEVAGYNVSEACEELTLAVTREGLSAVPITVSVSTANLTATTLDYSGLDQLELTIPSGASSTTFAVEILGDSVREDEEQFLVSLMLVNPRLGELLTSDMVTISIVDDDAVSIGFERPEYNFTEGMGVLGVNLVKSGGSETNVTVTLTTEERTAGDQDFTSVNRDVTFTPEDSEITLMIEITDDSILEGVESFQGVLAVAGAQDGVELGQDTATFWIFDNDNVTVGLQVGEYSQSESSGTVDVVVLKSGSAEIPVRVLLTTVESATATAPSDYLQVTELEMELQPSENQVVYQIAIVNDEFHENEETFAVRLSIPSDEVDTVQLEASEANITVVDDDDIQIGLEMTSYTVSEESGSLTIAVIKTGLSAIPITVLVSTENQTATNEDFDELNRRMVEFAPNVFRETLDIGITIDLIHEISEDFTVGLTLEDQGSGVQLTDSTATVTITNEDTVYIGFETAEYSFLENVGSFMINLMKTGSSEIDVTVTFTTSDSTAQELEDYFPVSQNVIFSPGDSVLPVTITITDDSILEAVESFQGLLAVTGMQQGVAVGLDTATFEITDDDAVVVEFEAGDYTVLEDDGFVEVVLLKIGSSDIPVSVLLTTSTSSSASAPGDYSPLIEVPVTFQSSEDRIVQRILIAADQLHELDEMFTVTLSFPADQSGVGFGQQNETTVTIEDDDELVVRFEATRYTVSEDSGSVGIGLVKEGLSEIPLCVMVTTSSGTAIVAVDYIPIIGQEVTFASNVSFILLEIEIIGDGLLEDSEIFDVTVSTSQDGVQINENTVSVTITDDDTVTIGFESSTFTTAEGTTAEVCATVTSGVLERDVTVSLTSTDVTAQAGADYTSVAASMMFSDVVSRLCVTVSINQDELLEGREEFQLKLATGDGSVVFAPDVATLVILSDDVVTVRFAVASYSVTEGDGIVSIGVIKVGSSEVDVTVLFQTNDGTAKAASDYLSCETAVTFAPGQSEQTVSVTLINDDILEVVESFTGTLSTSMDQVVIDVDSTTISITDDDSVTFAIDRTEYSVSEGDASVAIGIRREGSSAVDTRVMLSTSDATADGIADYTPITGQELTFAPNVSFTLLEIEINDDGLVEETETFEVTISTNQGGVRIDDGTALVAIVDNDADGSTGNTGVVGAVASKEDCVIEETGVAAAVFVILGVIILVLLILVLFLLFVLYKKRRRDYKLPHTETADKAGPFPISLEPLGVANITFQPQTPVDNKESPFGSSSPEDSAKEKEEEEEQKSDSRGGGGGEVAEDGKMPTLL